MWFGWAIGHECRSSGWVKWSGVTELVSGVEFWFSNIFFFLSLPLWSIGLISQFLDHFTDGRTPWTGDQLVARPLPKHRINAYTPNIHALCGIRTHGPGFRPNEDSTCLKLLGYRDRLSNISPFIIMPVGVVYTSRERNARRGQRCKENKRVR
jgi:hypothetical protein